MVYTKKFKFVLKMTEKKALLCRTQRYLFLIYYRRIFIKDFRLNFSGHNLQII